jgi:hypothetical protein
MRRKGKKIAGVERKNVICVRPELKEARLGDSGLIQLRYF